MYEEEGGGGVGGEEAERVRRGRELVKARE
jgi:hypothetical protein